MIIEVIGPAGSGKTTFVKKIYTFNKLFDNGEIAAFRGLLNCPEVKVHFSKILRYIPPQIAFKLRLTRITHLYRDQLLRSSYMEELELFLSHILNVINESDLKNAEKFWLIDKFKDAITDHILLNQDINKNRIIFIDEYLVQKILSLYYIHNSSIDISLKQKEYLRLVPKPKAIIFLDTDISIATNRAESRSKGRPHILKYLTEQKFIETNKRFKLIEKKICDYLNSKYSIQIVEVKNNSKLITTLKKISMIFSSIH
ncbi:MAG: hypothetical protein ACKKL4_02945 [Patescibacteria group bacterium]